MIRFIRILPIFGIALLSACTAIDISQLQPHVSSNIKTDSSCNISEARANAEVQGVNRAAMTNAIQAAKATLPTPLQQDNVVRALFALPLSAAATSTSRVNGQTPDLAAVPEANSSLTYDDLKQFANAVSMTYLQPTAASLTNAAPAPAPATADDAFGIYFRNYLEGTFYDRYGVNIAKPTFSTTVGDTEINGALTMLVEYLLDSVDKSTPVFGDAAVSPAANGDTIPEPSGAVTFYPGSSKYQPTAYAAGLAKYAHAPVTATTPCGITVDKVAFMAELAKAAGTSGNLLSGVSFGSFGGFGFSLFGFVKFSFGDNQTLSGAAKTIATRLAMRAAYDATYPIMLHVATVPKITIANGVVSASSN